MKALFRVLIGWQLAIAVVFSVSIGYLYHDPLFASENYFSFVVKFLEMIVSLGIIGLPILMLFFVNWARWGYLASWVGFLLFDLAHWQDTFEYDVSPFFSVLVVHYYLAHGATLALAFFSPVAEAFRRPAVE